MPDGARDRGHHERRVGDVPERHEPDPVGVARPRAPPRPGARAASCPCRRAPSASASRERRQQRRGSPPARRSRPTNEVSSIGRLLGRASSERIGGKSAGRPSIVELGDPFRAQVLEAVGAERPQGETGRAGGASTSDDRHLGQQHLSAVAADGDARRTVHVVADVGCPRRRARRCPCAGPSGRGSCRPRARAPRPAPAARRRRSATAAAGIARTRRRTSRPRCRSRPRPRAASAARISSR